MGQQFHGYIGGPEASVWGVKYRIFDPSDSTQPVRRLVVPKRHGSWCSASIPQTGQHRGASQAGKSAEYLADGDPEDIRPCQRCGKLTKLLIE